MSTLLGLRKRVEKLEQPAGHTVPDPEVKEIIDLAHRDKDYTAIFAKHERTFDAILDRVRDGEVCLVPVSQHEAESLAAIRRSLQEAALKIGRERGTEKKRILDAMARES